MKNSTDSIDSVNCQSGKTDGGNPILFRAAASEYEYRLNFILIVCSLILGLFLALPYLLHTLSGNWSSSSSNELVAMVCALGFCLPFAVILFKVIKYNQVIITDDYLFVNMGVSATSITIPVGELQGYYLERHSSRGRRSFHLNFWNKNGGRVRSGTLYLSDDDVEEITRVLETGLNLPVVGPWDIIRKGGIIKKENVGPGINKKTNYISLLISVSCLVAVLIALYIIYPHPR